jgi:hypothetical protein
MTSAEDYIQKLKSGALLVRLYMNKPKIDLMESNLSNPNINENKKNKIKKLLKSHIEDRLAYKTKVISIFKSEYQFSKVFFIHDYDYKKFLNGEKGLLLNEKGEYDNALNLDSNFLLGTRGDNDNTIIILQKSGDEMPKSFPSRYVRNAITGLISLFDNKDNLKDYVSKLNKKLENYHAKVSNQ